MKKTLLLLVISIVFQSCFSYKAVENNSSQYEIGKHYKLKQGKKSAEVKIISKPDSTLVVKHKSQEKEVLINTILKAQKRKFSVVKTVFSSIGVFIVVGTIASPPSTGGSIGSIQSPP